MKVAKIRVQKFRNITDTTLDTGGSSFVILRGKNGQGKSSLAEALSLALTDTTWGLDKRGAGFARKIKRGESKSVIEVDLQGAQRTIRRTATLSVTSSGRTQGSQDLNDPEWHPAKFDRLLEDKKVALGIAVNTRSFMSMVYSRDEDAQKSLLASLVLPKHYDFDKVTIAEVNSLIGEGTINFDGEPFTVIETAYKKLHKEREDANRKVRDTVIPEALPRPQGVNSELLNVQLAALREERQKQAVAREDAAKKANEQAQARGRTNARIETLEAVLKASKDALKAIEGDILPDPSAVQEIADRKTERDRLSAEKMRLSGAQEHAKREQDKINELSDMEGTCPTCEQALDEAKLVQLMTAIVTERTRLSEEYGKAVVALIALGDVDFAIAKIEKHKSALAQKSELENKVMLDANELARVKEEANQAIGGLFEPATFDTTISKTDKDIEAILNQIQPVTAAEERDKEIATKKEQLKRLEDKAAKLDRLVRYFDKDGIKAKLISEHIGGFEQKVNSVLSVWNYSCSLSIEPFKFEVMDYRKVTTPLIDLSGAEEIMFYGAFQCAVSKTAGIGFVVIDRVDTLLPDLRPKMFQHLYKMVTDGVLDQVILLIADTSEQVPKLANASFFAIEEGNIRRLG